MNKFILSKKIAHMYEIRTDPIVHDDSWNSKKIDSFSFIRVFHQEMVIFGRKSKLVTLFRSECLTVALSKPMLV